MFESEADADEDEPGDVDISTASNARHDHQQQDMACEDSAGREEAAAPKHGGSGPAEAMHKKARGGQKRQRAEAVQVTETGDEAAAPTGATAGDDVTQSILLECHGDLASRNNPCSRANNGSNKRRPQVLQSDSDSQESELDPTSPTDVRQHDPGLADASHDVAVHMGLEDVSCLELL